MVKKAANVLSLASFFSTIYGFQFSDLAIFFYVTAATSITVL